MLQHADILEDRESLRNPFFGSVLLHASILGALVVLSLEFNQTRESWGSKNPTGGGSVAISPVKTIPLQARTGRPNPVANPTESVVPPAPKKETPKERVKLPEPDAVPLKSKKHPKPEPEPVSNQKWHPETPYKPNQVFTTEGSAAVSPMFARQGAGAVGVDPNSVLGSRFGAYAALLMQRVAERWNTGGLEGARAPYAIVTVDILRDGSIRNLRLVQTSGNYQIDTSAQRAVMDVGKFPPLPLDYNGNVVNVEFRFQIQR